MILDTNALSAYADGQPAAVAAVDANPSIELPVVVLGEYRYGISHSRYKQKYESWIAQFVALCRVLDVTEETTAWYATVRSQLRRIGRPVPSNDAWIAALARQFELPVLSRDVHFDDVEGIRRVSW